MNILEFMVTCFALVCCGIGLGWLVYDINKQIKAWDERCESKEEDEE